MAIFIKEIEKQSKSKENTEKLRRLAIGSGYSSIRFLIAPDKIVSEEAVIEDVISLLESIENNEELETIYTTKGKK